MMMKKWQLKVSIEQQSDELVKDLRNVDLMGTGGSSWHCFLYGSILLDMFIAYDYSLTLKG